MRVAMLCFGVLLAVIGSSVPGLAQRVVATEGESIVFIASGEPRASFATAYISDNGADRDRIRSELGYLGLEYDRYVTLSNANAAEMLTDGDMVTALPARLLAQPFADRFFTGSYFAFAAGPRGLEAVEVRRPDGQSIAAEDIGVLAGQDRAVVPASDGLITLMASGAPVDGTLAVRRYAMTIPQDWLGAKFASSGLTLTELSEIGADDLAAAVQRPGEAVIFLSQNQKHATLAPVFDPDAVVSYYAVTNFGVMPVRPEAAPVPAQPQDSEAPVAAVSEPPAEASVDTAETAVPYFDLTSAEVYIVVAESQAVMDAGTYISAPWRMNVFDGAHRWIDVWGAEDYRRHQQVVHRYVAWIRERQGGDTPAFNPSGEVRLDTSGTGQSGPLKGQMPVVLSSRLAEPDMAVLRDLSNGAFAILDGSGLTPVRPVVGPVPEGDVHVVSPASDEGVADRQRLARMAPESYVIVPVSDTPIDTVFYFSRNPPPRFVDLLALPQEIRGPETRFAPSSANDLAELPLAEAHPTITEASTAFFYRANFPVDFLGDPMFDPLFVGDHRYFTPDGTEIEIASFPASRLPKTGEPQSPDVTAFCGVEEGAFLMAPVAREPGASQGMRFFMAATDAKIAEAGEAAGYGRSRQYHIMDRDRLRAAAQSLNTMSALAFSAPEVAAQVLGPDFECAGLVATRF